MIVLHNPNLLCSLKGPIVPLIKRVLDKLIPDLLFLWGSVGLNNL